MTIGYRLQGQVITVVSRWESERMKSIILFFLNLRLKRLRILQSWDCIKNNGYWTESQGERGIKIHRTLESIKLYRQSKGE